MAFTSEGMFYLGKEDLAPTIGLAGTGVRGMLGLQNKKEAVDSIMQSGDFSTPESRRGILEQIRAVDPTAYQKYAKENQEWEAKELGLAAKAGEPALKKAWKDIQAPVYTTTWVAQNLGVYEAMDDVPDNLKNPTTEAGVTNLVIWLAQNDSLLSQQQGKASKLIQAYKSMIKTERADYLELNKYNPPGSFESKQTRDINSIQGRGAYANTSQATDTATTTTPGVPTTSSKRMRGSTAPEKVIVGTKKTRGGRGREVPVYAKTPRLNVKTGRNR